MPIGSASDYLNRILWPQLQKFGVSPEYVNDLTQVVERQMASALYHWRDLSFRRALLLTASEEGLFYEPAGKKDVKCFVVLTVRNSPFESLQSNQYETCGLSQPLTDAQIKSVTSAAISYFNKIDFDQLSMEAARSGCLSDLYGDLSKQYPVAWNALTYLASSNAKRVSFTRYQVAEPYTLDGISMCEQEGLGKAKTVLDGFSPEIDQDLVQRLGFIADRKGAFIIDCFKMLTRNMEKLLRVMEFLLTRDCPLVTSNYYMENGYAERRPTVLRAACCEHAESDMMRHFSMINGLSPRHAQILKGAYDQLCGK